MIKEMIPVAVIVSLIFLFAVGCVYLNRYYGARYDVKVDGKLMHDNVTIVIGNRTGVLTVYDSSGGVRYYRGNWEVISQ